MKKQLNFIIMIILLSLFTNCKSSNIEPTKEYNLKIKSITTPLKTLKITLFDRNDRIIKIDSFYNVNKEISYDFDKCYKYELYATGSGFVIIYTLSKNDQFVETKNYSGIVDGGVIEKIRY